MISAIAIDDEPLAIQVVKEFCSRVDFIDLKATFTRAGKALEFLSENPVNLLFLDIEMPLISGIDLIEKAPQSTMVIFTTAYSQYAVEGFNLNAIDYLLKPFDFDRFLKASEKARDHFQYLNAKPAEEDEHLFIKVDYSIKKIELSGIRYIEGQDNYLKIHMDDGKSILVRMALKALLQQLPKSRFIRVHRSFIVPKNKVTAFRNKVIYLGDQPIVTSALYIDDVVRIFGAEQ